MDTHVEGLVEHFDRIARDLDRAAVDVRNARQALASADSCAEVVGFVQGDILRAVANLNLEDLTAVASRADAAKQRGETR